MINDMPRIEFVLDVTPEGAATYRVTTKATVPFTALGVIQPGDGFAARVVGEHDPTRMDIDWDAPIRAHRGPGSLAERLRHLDDLHAQGVIGADEHEQQRRRLLDTL